MATSGSSTGNVRTDGDIYMTLSWNKVSSDVANNTTTIRVVVTYTSKNDRYFTSTSNRSIWVYLNPNGQGTTEYSNNANGLLNISANSSKTIFDQNITIAHKADGTCSFVLNCTLEVNNTMGGTLIDYAYVTANTYTLDAISRGTLSYIYTGGEWKVGTPYIYNGTAWVSAQPKIYTSSAWT